jgi:tRNA wybutosine-synthesizing protein 1
MKNVPFHEEVLRFSRALCEASPFLHQNYELACEHEHSCCVLIANKKFNVDGAWHTWIDYPKFHELVKSGKNFTASDYMEKSPAW